MELARQKVLTDIQIPWPERPERFNPEFLNDVAGKIADVVADDHFTQADARAIIDATIADHYRNQASQEA